MLLFKYHLHIFLKILLLFTLSVYSRKPSFIFTTKQQKTTTIEQQVANLNLTSIGTPPEPTKPLNETLASLFSEFIRIKSTSLYEITKKFASYSLLNDTIHLQLRKETTTVHKNFSAILKETAERLSETLQRKSLITNSLSQTAENAYIDYKFDLELVNTSTQHVYYDSKSPKTFCDVSGKSRRTQSLLFAPVQHWKRSVSDFDAMISDFSRGNVSQVRVGEDDYFEGELTAKDDQGLSELFWDIDCLNRTHDGNFKSVEKANFYESTVHVPSNIFKQTLIINMTAYWTESLNKQFKLNNDNNKDLDWQYFCSSSGLYRQYPGAYWTVPARQDFFDCRLQSWYVNAATSPKDVLILLDTSGSMTGIRLEIAKKLVQLLFDTFTDNDFLNIITYSDVTSFLVPEFTDQFIQASKTNQNRFNEALKQFRNTSQQGNLKQALSKAFSLFNDSSLDRNQCNKLIMVVTDGQQDTVKEVFDEHNKMKDTRVFSFKIGRDSKDIDEIKKMACEYSNGEFFQVSLTDINEHVSKYVSVLSRPMAIKGVHETQWSNVFMGYLDNELKIAVSRPAFIRQDSLLEELISSVSSGVEYPDSINEIDRILEKDKQLNRAAGILLNQQVLLGVVGLDVPVLPLITDTSCRFRMNAGVYLIMLDSNGYVVYHPSIRAETAGKEITSFTGVAFNIDLDRFEIPIENHSGFLKLEHDMVDRKSGQKSLLVWKRCANRLVRRYTSFSFMPIPKTPFVIAIASPVSFGRHRLELNHRHEPGFYDAKLMTLLQTTMVNTAVQFGDCVYEFNLLAYELLFNESEDAGVCAWKILVQEPEQIMALKLDLILYQFVYESLDYTIFLNEPNSVRYMFYGSYSGAEFYLPVKYFSKLYPIVDEREKGMLSFEKSYFVQAVEFTDFLRSEWRIEEPYVHFKLNDTANRDAGGLTASIMIWLDRVPSAVANVVYEPAFVEDLLFKERFRTGDGLVHENVCADVAKVTCYLLDEHAVVVGGSLDSGVERGRPFYSMNPWVMLELEADGYYELIIPGSQLEDCTVLSKHSNSSGRLSSFVGLVLKIVYQAFIALVALIRSHVEAFSSSKSNLIKNLELNYEADVLYRNSHCSNFGIYAFNFYTWKRSNASELKAWCRKDDSQVKNFLVGYIEKSNLLMVVLENNARKRDCESIPSLIGKKRSEKEKKNFSKHINPNRYRPRKVDRTCYDFYSNESAVFRCNSAQRTLYINYNLLILVVFYYFTTLKY